MTDKHQAATQKQFLDVIDRDEAERRFHEALCLKPLGSELVSLDQALSRVLAEDIQSPVDVPCFDRSNFDGFAVRAEDTYGATEESPRQLSLLDEVIATAVQPTCEVAAGTAATIATGAMLPRGADAVVLVEHTDCEGDQLLVRKPVTSGFGVAFTGTDIGAGETVMRQGQRLTSRETGVLAAIGLDQVVLYRQPRVAIVSTGDEVIEPGQPMEPARVYDSNARILSDAVRELGGIPDYLGIVRDDVDELRPKLHQALNDHDVILLSGGTSKGAGDLSYRVVEELKDPGIVAHGVALKPGKPICLAVSDSKPVVILPGFPTSAVFTFHEFVAPVIRTLAGRSRGRRRRTKAELAVKVTSVVGRTEYLLVGLVPKQGPESTELLAAYPMGKGSGSVTTFSHADGFIAIDRHEEIVDAGQLVDVELLGRDLEPADLIVIGSHCVGLDYLLSQLQRRGYRTKFLAVGSTAGLAAAKRGECDVAGIHLLDPATERYNEPFLTEKLGLMRGYGRLQGIVFRPDDGRFQESSVESLMKSIVADPEIRMVNRNAGSGTRILIDQLLGELRPVGYGVQTRSHNAVVAAVRQGRADWGVAIETVARGADIGFVPLSDEQYDFVVPKVREGRPAVRELRELLGDPELRRELRQRGFKLEG